MTVLRSLAIGYLSGVVTFEGLTSFAFGPTRFDSEDLEIVRILAEATSAGWTHQDVRKELRRHLPTETVAVEYEEPLKFTYETYTDIDAIRAKIQECEGQHVQQVAYSTFMDALTQICFTEQTIRGMVGWEGARSWVLEG